jgi:peptidyl-prolyl cis-trans isomerase C
MTRTAPALVLSLALLACDHAPPPATTGALPPGVVARVGAVEISAERVARVAAAQRVSAAEAQALAVSDAVLAGEAAARGLDRAPAVEQEIVAELARRMSRRLLADARATPPTDEELREASARKWLEVDRPEGFRTVHAVVRHDATRDGEAGKARARAVAEAILAAVQPIAAQAADLPLIEGAPLPTSRQLPAEDPDPLSGAFRRAAATVPSGGLEVTIEPLAPTAADGRTLVAAGGQFDLDFAAAAARLPARGALSPVVQSAFGFHVVLLLERTPALVLSPEARVARLRDDIVNERARAAEKRLLATLKSGGSAAPEAPGLLDLVRVDP